MFDDEKINLTEAFPAQIHSIPIGHLESVRTESRRIEMLKSVFLMTALYLNSIGWFRTSGAAIKSFLQQERATNTNTSARMIFINNKF